MTLQEIETRILTLWHCRNSRDQTAAMLVMGALCSISNPADLVAFSTTVLGTDWRNSCVPPLHSCFRPLCPVNLMYPGVGTLKSRTARRYVPEVRRLLAEVEATTEWVPGSENLANQYSRNQQSFPDDLGPLERLKIIPPDRLAFKDFLGVKSGRDGLSRMKKEQIVQLLGQEQWQ